MQPKRTLWRWPHYTPFVCPTLAVTSRGEQGEPRSGALRSWAASTHTVYSTV